jgi:hypothetical protein
MESMVETKASSILQFIHGLRGEHCMPLRNAVSTGVVPSTAADSRFGLCCCTSVLSLKRSVTGLPRFCLQPRYRSVVCTDPRPSIWDWRRHGCSVCRVRIIFPAEGASWI